MQKIILCTSVFLIALGAFLKMTGQPKICSGLRLSAHQDCLCKEIHGEGWISYVKKTPEGSEIFCYKGLKVTKL